MSCLELAAHLHAFIYILQYTEIDDPYNITRPLGAITAKGDFVLNPEISNSEYEYIQSEFMGVIEQRKQQAFSKINAEQDLNPNFNPNSFNHRNILIFADILNTTFQIQIALDTLKPYTPLNIYGAFGNITLPISNKLQLEADGLIIKKSPNKTCRISTTSNGISSNRLPEIHAKVTAPTRINQASINTTNQTSNSFYYSAFVYTFVTSSKSSIAESNFSNFSTLSPSTGI